MKKLFLKTAFSSSILMFSGCEQSDFIILDNNYSQANNIDYHETTIIDNPKNIIVNSDITPNDPIYKYQWHLKNLATEKVWNRFTGKRIKVGIVDSGIELAHPDLYQNINQRYSFRYSDNSNDPSPDFYQLQTAPYNSAHGTACAGIIGAVGWNGQGVIGIAPAVDLVGLNTFSTGEDSDFEDALGNLNVDISNNSWGGQDSLVLYDDPYSIRGIENGIKNGRDGKGIIYIFASGNEAHNSNYSTLHGSRFVFNIGAVLWNDEVPTYSNFGDNLLITAPAGDVQFSDNKGIFTTDLLGFKYGFDNYQERVKFLSNFNGDYTGFMNGTSSAVPVVSGVVALILEANPNLTYRDVKYILAKTSKVKNLDNAKYKWEKNGAGLWFSPFYGFGIVNLVGSIKMAETFKTLSSQILETSSKENLNSEINISKNLKIEHITLTLNIPNYENIGDLEIKLISPSGTVSTLMYGGINLVGEFKNWDLNSLKFLDENSRGTWKIQVNGKDEIEKSSNWKLQVFGRLD